MPITIINSARVTKLC